MALQPIDGFDRPLDRKPSSAKSRCSSKPNKLAMKAGYAYCEATEAFQISYEIPPAKLRARPLSHLSGNQALALGFVAARKSPAFVLFQGSYPITPASDILHELSQYKDLGVITFSGRDESPPSPVRFGAGLTPEPSPSPQRPALAWLSKPKRWASPVAVEIPLIVLRYSAAAIYRPPDKNGTQADLLQASFGRNSEAPIPIVAAANAERMFWAAIEGRSCSPSSTWFPSSFFPTATRQRRRTLARPPSFRNPDNPRQI